MHIFRIVLVTALLAASWPALALSGKPSTHSVINFLDQVLRDETVSRTLPSLRIETCAECELEAEEIAAWKRTYAEAAAEAGYDIDLLVATPVRVVETGLLPNGTPYVIGETGGMRFRVGDPDPGATLGMALGRMTFVIHSSTEAESAK